MDVELTAYVLLALLATEKVSKEEIASATGIVAWLARQQNAYGGFASTQVTNQLLSEPDTMSSQGEQQAGMSTEG